MGLYKGYESFEEHDFLALGRFICIQNYPEPKRGTHHQIGDIYQKKIVGKAVGEDIYYENPSLFRLLDWWEYRTFDEMFSIRYIQISEYKDYFTVGDILEVDEYDIIANDKKPSFHGFISSGHKSSVKRCIPLRKYKDFDRISSTRIYQK